MIKKLEQHDNHIILIFVIFLIGFLCYMAYKFLSYKAYYPAPVHGNREEKVNLMKKMMSHTKANKDKLYDRVFARNDFSYSRFDNVDDTTITNKI